MNTAGEFEPRCCAVLELRQYTLKPGRRDALIDLFDRHFIESQEALDMSVVGQFRDRRRPDRFVWLRGFSGMESRRNALAAFYDGAIWGAHKAKANDTMLDSDNVLLLKPARPDLAFRMNGAAEEIPPPSAGPLTVLAGIYQMTQPIDAGVVSDFEHQVAPILQANGVRIEGVFVTEPAPNTYPRLPVREGEHVLVWFGIPKDRVISSEWLDRLTLTTSLGNQQASLLELEPTSRSVLGRGAAAARASKHDFDFVFGSWNVHNRFLNGRLRQSTEWLEFDARSDVRPLLDGFGHLDCYSTVRDGEPFEGITLRLFDPATGEWLIHWADSQRAHRLLPPMVGRFTGDVGEFFGGETVDGKDVLCRFLWTRAAGLPRWEQAFSDDGGTTWETNWIMTFTRS
jgi:hypothetical protein